MKNQILTLVLFFCIIQLSKAQVIPKPKTMPIEVLELNIKNPINSKKILYGETADKIIQAFGTPTSSEPFLFEMDEKVGTLYKYGLNEFYFMDNKLYLFIIKTNSCLVGTTNYIKIGDPISTVSNFYPNYSLSENTVRVRLKSGFIELDGSLIVKTNGSNITEIIFHLD